MDSSNSRIAKNAISLYIRMGINILVKLYTSRILLEALGVDDYGTWNVVASLIVTFSFVCSPLVSATQRFLNYDMGKGGVQLNKIFNTSLELFLGLGIVLIVLLETVGLWFLNTQMNFETDKLSAVNLIYHLSVLGTFVNLLRMPYESTLVAYEQMSFYAVMSILEAALLLGTALLIQWDIINQKLIIYGVLTLLSTIVIFATYVIYCRNKFEITKIKWCWEEKLFKEIGKFSGWNLLGACASMTSSQGINILMNMFFGVAINAANGIATQVYGMIVSLVQNFQKAANPQIVKSYSNGDLQRTHSLIGNVGKFSFALSLAFVVPMIFNINFILRLWLGNNVPEYTAELVSINMIQFLLVTLSAPIDIGILATGRIGRYQIMTSLLILCNIVFTYIFYSYGALPYIAMIIRFAIELLITFVRIGYLKHDLKYALRDYLKRIILPVSILFVLSFSVMLLLTKITFNCGNWSRLLWNVLLFVPIYMALVYIIILSSSQKAICRNYLCKVLGHYRSV